MKETYVHNGVLFSHEKLLIAVAFSALRHSIQPCKLTVGREVWFAVCRALGLAEGKAEQLPVSGRRLESGVGVGVGVELARSHLLPRPLDA